MKKDLPADAIKLVDDAFIQNQDPGVYLAEDDIITYVSSYQDAVFVIKNLGYFGVPVLESDYDYLKQYQNPEGTVYIAYEEHRQFMYVMTYTEDFDGVLHFRPFYHRVATHYMCIRYQRRKQIKDSIKDYET